MALCTHGLIDLEWSLESVSQPRPAPDQICSLQLVLKEAGEMSLQLQRLTCILRLMECCLACADMVATIHPLSPFVCSPEL